MSALSDSKVTATIAVSDLGRARQFYEGKLGLSATNEDGEAQVVTYACGAGSELFVYVSEHAGKATATVATWEVSGLEQLVDELSAKGVEFERYDEPMKTDEKGILRSERMGAVAWFKDPDGNTIAVGEFAS
ncbi:MAG TPA: VOC family protein [Solirubrobacterales bacterium]|jgi:catechol 2,3-dioxygenase-like lactoylglutathione lyase family enzyme